MDAELQKTCHREIGHIVFDANEKITIRKISNTWSLDSKQAIEVLQKWLEEQKESKKLSVEYVVRGIDKNGNLFISMANAEKLEKVSKNYPHCMKMLYSVEIASDVRPLNVVNDNEFSVMKIRLNSEKRQIAQPSQKEAPTPVKPDPKPSKPNMFAMASKAPVKEEKHSPPATPVVSVKEEPKTATPPKASPKTQSPKKDTKKAVATGKGAISSFFSSKPGQSTAVAAPKAAIKQEPPSPATKAVEKATKKPEPVKKEEKTRKRTHTDDEEATEEDEDVIPNTPQEDRKRADSKKRTSKKPLLQRKKASNPSKKSRLLEICDSSSDEELDEKEAAVEQRKERLVEFDHEEMEQQHEKEEGKEPEAQKPSSLSPEKPVENDSNSVNRNRSKVKKLITKTYTDEKGYLITMKDYEMVSEDESSATEKETATPTETPKQKAGAQGKASSVEKKVTPPTPKTKQGSIMSFFAKK
ncbi:DNA polymerase delta subunit 3 [Anopheles maculipalpis]|uniref:DNA polymerase delta subunit 3 n=1 Tax=Anopheles maculipalpis TaxID=1496333 RepID=UPI002158F310|nr:DNA polymerase delta subunit 3 [Anopheles maculipalpis]